MGSGGGATLKLITTALVESGGGGGGRKPITLGRFFAIFSLFPVSQSVYKF